MNIPLMQPPQAVFSEAIDRLVEQGLLSQSAHQPGTLSGDARR